MHLLRKSVGSFHTSIILDQKSENKASQLILSGSFVPPSMLALIPNRHFSQYQSFPGSPGRSGFQFCPI